MATTIGSFSIRVMDSDGDPKEGIEVFCFLNLVNGTCTETTDADGWVTIPIYQKILGDSAISVETIYVDGEIVREDYGPEDGDTMSFTI